MSKKRVDAKALTFQHNYGFICDFKLKLLAGSLKTHFQSYSELLWFYPQCGQSSSLAEKVGESKVTQDKVDTGQNVLDGFESGPQAATETGVLTAKWSLGISQVHFYNHQPNRRKRNPVYVPPLYLSTSVGNQCIHINLQHAQHRLKASDL